MNRFPQTLEELNSSFAPRFETGEGGLPRAVLTHGESMAHVYTLGAHVAHYQAEGHEPLLWVSTQSHFEPGRPIRGGVPVCLPWFAEHQDRPDLPLHGFARTRMWRVVQAATPSTITLELESDADSLAIWPYHFLFRMTVTLHEGLAMALTVENRNSESITITEALHSYFRVSDVRQVVVTGLEGVQYLSKPDHRSHSEQDPITIRSETDRVYVRTTSPCELHDPGLNRRIVIAKVESASTVVWNPWIDKSRVMPDFGEQEWLKMLCIETANALDDAVTIAADESHTLGVNLSVHPLH